MLAKSKASIKRRECWRKICLSCRRYDCFNRIQIVPIPGWNYLWTRIVTDHVFNIKKYGFNQRQSLEITGPCRQSTVLCYQPYKESIQVLERETWAVLNSEFMMKNMKFALKVWLQCPISLYWKWIDEMSLVIQRFRGKIMS